MENTIDLSTNGSFLHSEITIESPEFLRKPPSLQLSCRSSVSWSRILPNLFIYLFIFASSWCDSPSITHAPVKVPWCVPGLLKMAFCQSFSEFPPHFNVAFMHCTNTNTRPLVFCQPLCPVRRWFPLVSTTQPDFQMLWQGSGNHLISYISCDCKSWWRLCYRSLI